jgi:hypothetical protein
VLSRRSKSSSVAHWMQRLASFPTAVFTQHIHLHQSLRSRRSRRGGGRLTTGGWFPWPSPSELKELASRDQRSFDRFSSSPIPFRPFLSYRGRVRPPPLCSTMRIADVRYSLQPRPVFLSVLCVSPPFICQSCSSPPRSLPQPSLAASTNFTVTVGAGGLQFTPNNLTADVGDMVTFVFRAKNQ